MTGGSSDDSFHTFIERSIGYLFDWLIDWMVDHSINWLIKSGNLPLLIIWSIGWLIDWLIDWKLFVGIWRFVQLFTRHGHELVENAKKWLHFPGFSPSGHLYLIFDTEKSVKQLLGSCSYDFNQGHHNWYYKVSSKRMRVKEVQVIPWQLADASYVRNGCMTTFGTKTVFVGSLHGMLTAEGLAKVLDDLFQGVVAATIDTGNFLFLLPWPLSFLPMLNWFFQKFFPSFSSFFSIFTPFSLHFHSISIPFFIILFFVIFFLFLNQFSIIFLIISFSVIVFTIFCGVCDFYDFLIIFIGRQVQVSDWIGPCDFQLGRELHEGPTCRVCRSAHAKVQQEDPDWPVLGGLCLQHLQHPAGPVLLPRSAVLQLLLPRVLAVAALGQPHWPPHSAHAQSPHLKWNSQWLIDWLIDQGGVFSQTGLI